MLDYRNKDPFRLLVLAVVALLCLPCLFTEHWIVSYLNKCLIIWFHEAGHGVMSVFWTWGWFGRFLVYAGGSAFQILVPLMFLVAVFSTGRMFQASLVIFMIAINFVDVSYYAADGALRERGLIFNMDKDSHDWGNILSMFNLRGQAQLIGWCIWLMGVVSWFLGLGISYVVAEQEYGRLTT
ncbi:MAG: hypothetical protein JWM80_583 [Cyanobacteria bacterium RYN_339]|nr:hypothetical protein [Cyanobacteria bacterium RYN_339]